MPPRNPRKDARAISRRRLIRTVVLGGIGVTALAQGTEVGRLKVERQALRLPKWKADGLKVALLTDLHVNDKQETERAIEAVGIAGVEKPDVILFGGDFLNTPGEEALRNVRRVLDAADDTGCRAFAVLGNHDYWVPTTPELIEQFRGRRTRLLRNELVGFGDATIWGIDDGIAGRDRHMLDHRHRDDPSILALFHEPDFVSRVHSNVGIMLAGHSHGGQMCLPFGVPLHTPRGARTYIAGFYADAPVPLYVSRGIGTVGPKLRLFCPPEVSILTLNSEDRA
ncbi:MAG: metallophosphoesterase [Armatimonadetes bacterium]|nr:metallophosphoesterase [Armatimonadota bacterium]